MVAVEVAEAVATVVEALVVVISTRGNPTETDTETQAKNTPLCLWQPHRRNGLCHYLKHCRECQGEEKNVYAQLAEYKAYDGPANNMPSQTQAKQTPVTTNANPKTGRLRGPISAFDFLSCPIEVSDGTVTHLGIGGCDDGRDQSTVSRGLLKRQL